MYNVARSFSFKYTVHLFKNYVLLKMFDFEFFAKLFVEYAKTLVELIKYSGLYIKAKLVPKMYIERNIFMKIFAGH
jgi:hypothetical protein